MAAIEESFSISKEFFEKKVNGEIVFALISLFHEQGQEPGNIATITRAFVSLAKFIITRYLEQGVDHDSSICVDECSPCGLFL